MPGTFLVPRSHLLFLPPFCSQQIQFSSRRVGGIWPGNGCCTAWQSPHKPKGSGTPQKRSSPWLCFHTLFSFIAKNQPWLSSPKSSVLRAVCWVGHDLLPCVHLCWHPQLPPSALKSVLVSCLALSGFPSTTLSTGALRQHAESNIIQPDWGLQFLAWCLGEHRSALLSFLCLGPCPLTLSADVLDWCTLSTRCDTGIKCSGFEAPNLGIIFSSELESQSKFEIFMNLN